MKKRHRIIRPLYLFMAFLLLPALISGCSSGSTGNKDSNVSVVNEPDTSKFLVAVEEKPDTVDFQCTSIHYTVAQNVFNRLVEVENNAHGSAVVLPSLAEKWEVSDDGKTYTFHLREGVKFSNGSPLTSTDVQYSFTRLLTHPDSCNQDIVLVIKGADKLSEGKADELEGFEVVDDLTFNITLEEPFSAFPACLSMPGASILDEETTSEAGDKFGKDPESTVGTGSFVLWKWTDEEMLLTANKQCWNKAPKCEGLDLKFLTDPDEIEAMFEEGKLDILDLNVFGGDADKYMNDEAYKDRLFRAHPVGITYIALNESVKPLNDKKVRKALQLALDRKALLDKALSGRGEEENGIFPHGLYGYNEKLPEIPNDVEQAKKLMDEAGCAGGFDLKVSLKTTSSQWEKDMMEEAASMWKEIGVNTTIETIEEEEWMELRKGGKIPCYTATWTADYNDPDNFIYTFFGNEENTIFRSICYTDKKNMKRVRDARTIKDKDMRIAEYRDLEAEIIQDDAAWIPLFSRLRYYVKGERLGGMKASWNGSVKNNYKNMTIDAK